MICVEHDLSVLDYLSDFICCLYGQPSVYGVVTLPFGVREGRRSLIATSTQGINIFLDGMIPTENLRFRDESLTFKIMEITEGEEMFEKMRHYSYPSMEKTLGNEF